MNFPSLIEKKRTLLFTAVIILFFACNLSTLYSLFRFSLAEETWSHIPVIPLISAFFFFRARKTIFNGQGYSLPLGSIVLATGLLGQSIAFVLRKSLHETGYLAVAIPFFIVSFFGIFLVFFGTESFKKALFPLLLLLFMVPLPPAIERIIVELFRFGSVEMVNLALLLSGVFFVREGSTFHFDSLSINVASQCSGIRSGLSLLIVSVIAGKLFLRSPGSRLLFSLAVLPIGWIKNGLRITTLSLLGNYVNFGFLHGPLHRQGGRPFFVIGLIMLGAWLFICRVVEKKLWRS